MDFVKEEHIKEPGFNGYFLAGDVGGTKASLGLFGAQKNNFKLIASFHFKSKELKGLEEAINLALDKIKNDYGINVRLACFAIAGVLSEKKDFVEVTNIHWDVSKKGLMKKTKLRKILLINDFEAIGYGINSISQKDIALIKKGSKTPKAPIVVVGAGTGLGKTMLVYDKHLDLYTPLASEAGHGDFAAQGKGEIALAEFIKKYKKSESVSFEDVLSGGGLANIYAFLRKSGKFKSTIYTRKVDAAQSKPELISSFRKKDNTCAAAFKMFKIAYARFAKNCALDALAFGGVYIAGGIAQKNAEIFDAGFISNFVDNQKMKNVLEKIPVYLVTNKDIGLNGAGFFGLKFLGIDE